MRAVILLEPPEHARESLPRAFSEPLDAAAVREWLAHPSARRHLRAVPAEARFDHAVPQALNLDTPAGGVLVTYLAGHSLVSDEDWDALGLSAAFDNSKSQADERVEALIEEAQRLFDADDWHGAGSSFRDAGDRLQHELSARHAEVLVGLGEIDRLQGRTEQARAHLDRALAMVPDHDEALRGRAAIARTTGEHAICAALTQRLTLAERDIDALVELQRTVAKESLAAALAALESALTLRPLDTELLRQLRAANEAAEQWKRVVDIDVQLAEALPTAEERARALVEAARLCRERVNDRARSIALYELAIENDARATGAFEAIETALFDAEDYGGLARAYERQLERMGTHAPETERLAMLGKLGSIARDKLGDTKGAIRAFDAICAIAPEDTQARVALADLLDVGGEHALALRCLEVASRQRSTNASLIRRMYRIFQRTGDTDRAFCASATLVTLGEATAEEQLTYASSAPAATIDARRPFDDDVWAELRATEHSEELDELMSTIQGAAIGARLAALRTEGQLPMPPESWRQDPKTTTVSAVRSFAWASRLLGVPEPAIYAQAQNAQVGSATIPGDAPMVLLGRPVLTGRSIVELSFIAARHLTYLRPGYAVLAYYPTMEELNALARAAVVTVRTEAAGSLPDVERKLAQDLRARLNPEAHGRLAAVVERIELAHGKLDMRAWARSVEKVACRAGLLACGDVTVVGTALNAAGSTAGLTARERYVDLLSFGVSQKHSALRRMLGIR